MEDLTYAHDSALAQRRKPTGLERDGGRHRSEAEPVPALAHDCRRMSDCRMVAAQVFRLNTEC